MTPLELFWLLWLLSWPWSLYWELCALRTDWNSNCCTRAGLGALLVMVSGDLFDNQFLACRWKTVHTIALECEEIKEKTANNSWLPYLPQTDQTILFRDSYRNFRNQSSWIQTHRNSWIWALDALICFTLSLRCFCCVNPTSSLWCRKRTRCFCDVQRRRLGLCTWTSVWVSKGWFSTWMFFIEMMYYQEKVCVPTRARHISPWHRAYILPLSQCTRT